MSIIIGNAAQVQQAPDAALRQGPPAAMPEKSGG